jgi:hypothetical protein
VGVSEIMKTAGNNSNAIELPSITSIIYAISLMTTNAKRKNVPSY